MVESQGFSGTSTHRPLQVRVCETTAEREAVFRLRYEIYVAEMGRPQPHADHAGRRVTDALDDNGLLLGLWEGDALVGTLRFHRVSQGIGRYAALYGLEGLSPEDAERTSVVTLLMVAASHRSRGGRLLCQSIYAEALGLGVTTCWVDANAPRVPMFHRLGFRTVSTFQHPLYGEVELLRMDLLDRDRIREVDSPFLEVIDDPRPFLPHRSPPMSAPSMLSRLRSEFGRVAERFHAHPACARLRRGDFTVEEYASLMSSISLQARENPQIQAYATAFFRGWQRDLVKAFYKHAVSEIGHDQLAADDMAACGYASDDLFETPPRAGTVALTSFAYYAIDHIGPVSYLGYLFFLEFLPTQFGAEYVAALDRAGVPAEARTFLHDHATIDMGHNKLMERYVEDLVVDEETFASVVYAMEVTGRLYAHMIDEAFELAPTLRQPRPRLARERRVRPDLSAAAG